tara:strand:- start:3762 stop:4091 length:330 start_codon:yes stop_codon:yes gene_type:complete
MADFDRFLRIVKTDLVIVAENLGRDYAKEIVTEGTDFARRFQERLERRITLLANGELSKEEFEWLMKSEKNLIELKSIEKKGLAVVQLNEIRDAIIDTLIVAAFKVITL